MPDRMLKINELLRQQLGEIISEEIELPANTLVTIIRVSTSPDLHYTRAMIGVIPDENSEQVVGLLNRRAKHFRKILGDKITLRFLPQISFALDESERKAYELDRLLDNLK